MMEYIKEQKPAQQLETRSIWLATFIEFAIRTFMLEKGKPYLSDNSTSLKKVFSQLKNIMIITTPAYGHFTKALTKKQKGILSAFDAKTEIVHDVIIVFTLI